MKKSKSVVFLASAIVMVVLPFCYCQEVNDINDYNEMTYKSWSKDGSGFGQMNCKTGIAGRFVGAIVVVAILAVAAYYLTKKLGPKISTITGKNIRTVETINLGGQKRLYVVEVEGKRLLIGATNENISLIKDLSGGPAEQYETD